MPRKKPTNNIGKCAPMRLIDMAVVQGWRELGPVNWAKEARMISWRRF